MIVEFLEANAFCLGWVLSNVERGRLEVLLADRVVKLAPQRILTSEEAPDPGSNEGRRALIRDREAARAALADAVSLPTLWEVLEGEGENFAFEALASLEFGRAPSPPELSALWRAVHADGLYFKFSPQGARRLALAEREKILSIRAREKEKAETQKAWVAYLAQSHAESRLARAAGPSAPPPLAGDAREEETPEPPAAPPQAEALNGYLLDLALAGEEGSRASHRTALETLESAGMPANPEGAFEALVHLGVFSPDENLDLRRLALPLEFPPAALEEAQALALSRDYLNEDRLDLTEEEIFTVDSEGAMEFDDAISLSPGENGRTVLGVHIADVAAFVKPGGPLDLFAAERAASIYLPEGRYPMLPGALTEKVLSLNMGDVRPAFSLQATIGPGGEFLDALFKPSLIKVKKRLTFGEADAILRSQSDPLFPKLESVAALTQILGKKRVAAGCHSFNIPTLQITLAPDGTPVADLRDFGDPASVMVGEIMIAANHLAAYTLQSHSFPCPFRYQLLSKSAANVKEGPYRTPMELLAAHLSLRRRLGRAGISAEPSRHRGLGLDHYTYFTSPMRRYFDLLVHRQLRALASGTGPVYDEKTLMREAYNADEVLRNIHRVQNNRVRYWIYKILEKKIGELVPALAFERIGPKTRVCLLDYLLEAELYRLPDSVESGQELFLRVAAADARRQKLSLDFASLKTA
ncbi:MAG: RNB domain-containing ribonuclease [Deltaproteobacteria bacterium]|nr:RNB domain-containing ribonuclease [Deltaproteobacteria bacterium]